ncbi:MAG: hypothetical protein PWQ84_27 [Thermotogaceae bacterium]|jgi:multisubunit Na+/H+ antiporter MnhE subunit|nr:hypothetical protein [Thermotogaceae bacterium]
MFIIFLVSVLWLSLTYQYGYESYIILLILDICIFLIQRKLIIAEKYDYKKRMIFTFLFSFFSSFISAFQVTFLLLFQKIHRGIYEVVVEDVSRLDQFFLSTSITIVPNTLYLDRIGDTFLIHKIASYEKEAHKPDKLIFLKK